MVDQSFGNALGLRVENLKFEVLCFIRIQNLKPKTSNTFQQWWQYHRFTYLKGIHSYRYFLPSNSYVVSGADTKF